MANIINDPGAGARIGSSLGEGLGQGITKFAEGKLAQMQKEQQLPSFRAAFPNYNEQQLQSLMYQDPQFVRELYKQQMLAPQYQALSQYFGGQQPGSPQTQQFNAGNQSAMQGQQQGNMTQPSLNEFMNGGVAPNQQGRTFKPEDINKLFQVAPALAPKFAPILQGQVNAAETARHHGVLEEQGAEKISQQDKKLAISTNKDFVDRQSAIREAAPGAIRNYDKIINIYEKNPNQLLTGAGKRLAENLHIDWLFQTGKQDIVDQGLAQEAIQAAQLWRGLGSYSDREGIITQQAMASRYNTPQGAKAILKSSKARREAELAIANEEAKIRENNKGWLPLGGDLLARKNAEPALTKAAESEKNAFREIGVLYPYDIPKTYLAQISQLPNGQEFTIEETGTRWIKTPNGPVAKD